MNKRQQSWFATPEELAKATKTGAVLTKPTAPTPEQHLQDAKQGKVTNFDKSSKGKG
jgi:hypothetical protein